MPAGGVNKNAPGETTPLLASTAHQPEHRIDENAVAVHDSYDDELSNGRQSRPVANDDEPLPKFQLAVLSLASLVDPLSFFAIFPFIPKMVEMMKVEESNVGFYTGIIESLFSITQVLTMFWWGKAADRYGRKPVLIVSLLGVATGSTLFGISRTLWQMMLFRCFSGLFSGSVVAIRAMFQENSVAATQARAFSYFAFARNLGIFLGPAIGSLARPADQYPGTFGKIQFFRDWPYILPTAITGAVGFTSVFICAICLQETLQQTAMSGSPPAKATSSWSLMKHPGVPSSIIAMSWAGMLGFAFTAICPVYFYTSVSKGGFGLPERLISLFISVNGISQAFWLLLIFPPLQRRIGTKQLLQGCGFFWPVFLCIFPLSNWLLREQWTALFWAVALFAQTLGSGVAMAFTGTQLAVNDATPSPEVLGTLNGLALTVNSAVRAVTPPLFSSIYAAGVNKQILGGQLGMLVLAVLAGCFYFVATSLRDSPTGDSADDGDRRITPER